ncbi:MotA/TolQ/ExbB proton channel family protein [Paremcibacter congregatus]|uniref:Energy transducer TonB n=1 Tax=Paremcibacter congregatus TaxID=2043170 RepID=A0A2G4YU74_9PROT|nr:MotA/TolQ/ExbB proton channel family protein [Paremcibacter congregatus]PHZ85016.1 energy transducer TonB [Paremcibacter congregatus]QDE26008.1 MotA/TolQ/ExbB proton channel family protein [Paremcibacter congregatus]
MRKLVSVIIAVAMAGFGSTAFAQSAAPEAKNLDELLELVKQGAYQQNQENKRREREFVEQKSQQATLLANARNTQKQEERRSDRLEAEFKANEDKISKLEEELSHELGALKELFGVLQQVSGDAKAVFNGSIISAQFPGREKYLNDLIAKASSSELPTIDEIAGLWFEVQREMTESGKVVKFNADVQYPSGEIENKEVVRVGTFNLISGGKYLEWRAKYQNIAELPRQPKDRFLETAAGLQAADSGIAPFALDVSRGTILGLLIQDPSILERIDQGGIIGYIIIYGLGPLSLLLIIVSGLTLLVTRGKVKAQIRSDEVNENNPLGRVLSVYDNNKSVDVETLELKLDEAILKETPSLERFLTMIKVIAAVAPLMGLLGTVTGMINTFQSMTLFGTGDPKLMAGGISQALVTTVLGIVVALPTIFLHSIVAGWSKDIIHTLEEQSAGIIAVHAEQGQKGA